MSSDAAKDTTGKMKADNDAKEDFEEIEHVKPSKLEGDQSELSNIEGTAASKAAWLISIVVSIGGLLFGETPLQPCLCNVS
jgi:hypothetical protein